MGGHHDRLAATRRIRAGQDHAQVHDLHRLADALAVGLRGEPVLERLQSRPLGDRGELARQPLSRRDDPATGTLAARERVPGAEPGQALHRGLQASRIDPLHQRFDARVAPLLCEGWSREQQGKCQELHRVLRQSR